MAEAGVADADEDGDAQSYQREQRRGGPEPWEKPPRGFLGQRLDSAHIIGTSLVVPLSLPVLRTEKK